MNKFKLLKISNLVLFISAGIQVLTGVVLFFDLFVMRSKLFMAIVQIHKYNGLIFTALVILHLALNWGWIRSQFFKRSARRI